jgi:hypothetical protein
MQSCSSGRAARKIFRCSPYGSRCRLFADHSDENFSPMRRATVFEKENALPRPELYFAIYNWHRLARTCQDHSDM